MGLFRAPFRRPLCSFCNVCLSFRLALRVSTAFASLLRVQRAAQVMEDLEDYFRRWRFNHVTTVERVIGFKRGTGGTGGVSYLKRMLETELFPELWHLRTDL